MSLSSKDSDFSYPIQKLSQRGHEIILVTTRRFIRATSLCSATFASHIIDSDDLHSALEYDMDGKIREPRSYNPYKVVASNSTAATAASREKQRLAAARKQLLLASRPEKDVCRQLGMQRSLGWACTRVSLSRSAAAWVECVYADCVLCFRCSIRLSCRT